MNIYCFMESMTKTDARKNLKQKPSINQLTVMVTVTGQGQVRVGSGSWSWSKTNTETLKLYLALIP